jgi:pSer/pThr/pTyr-binding forkhead associated (FHA) protein
MDVILKVTKGSKVGAKIAVKKDEFLIGRSPECHLCAASTSISRKHCAITRSGTSVKIKDLGSRNGTLVNGSKIEGEVELHSGDEIAIGSLGFMITMTSGLTNEKKPEVKSVAEAVERVVAKTSGPIGDDDISGWLIDSDKPKGAFSDTQTIKLDDTKASELREAVKEMQAAAAAAETTESPVVSDPTSDKSKAKKEPGKLPQVTKGPATKDSREAAAEALRSWNRRR